MIRNWMNFLGFILFGFAFLLPDPYQHIVFLLIFLYLSCVIQYSYHLGKRDIRREFVKYIPPVLISKKRSVAEFGMEIAKNWEDTLRMQSVLDSIREGVLAVDSEGRILLYNHSATQLLQSDFIEKRMSALKLPNKIDKLLKKNKEGAEWVWKRGKKPNRTYIHCSVVQWDYGGLIVFRDITKIRRLERVRRDFFANVSHELKTPMAIIRANAEALSEGAFHDEVMGPKFVDALLRNSERLDGIVSSMLDLAHLEAGTYELFLSMYELEPLIQKSIEIFLENKLKGSYTITVDVEEGLKAYLDVQAFSHIVHNFVENAIKYTGGKGTIRVTGRQTENGVRVAVEDNGPGIDSKHASRIFERFYRIDKGRARDEGGTGLGLSIVRNMADAMGAHVGVCDSKLGGAEFWCLFSIVK